MHDPTIEAARDLLADSLAELRKAVAGCSADELNRRPVDDDTNPLAVLATHAMHSTRSWLSLATGAPLPERDRPAEFRAVVDDPDAFIGWLDAIGDECRSLLQGGATYDPGASASAPWSTVGSDEPVTAAWALLHALEHLREHVGHAQLTRQVLERPSSTGQGREPEGR
ncbi:MAG: DinB family protein [Actinomycetota bacterium]